MSDGKKERVARMSVKVVQELKRRLDAVGEHATVEIREDNNHGLHFRVLGGDGEQALEDDLNEVYWCPPRCDG